MFFKKKCFVCENKFRKQDLTKMTANCVDGKIELLMCKSCLKEYAVEEQEAIHEFGVGHH